MSRSPRALRYRTPADMPEGMRRCLPAGMYGLFEAPAAPAETATKRHAPHTAGVMNKTEARYAQLLDARKAVGEIEWWGFEVMKLRLAPRTHLTVDFVVVLASGEIEAVDVKGRKGDRYWAEEDAKVKLKVAAEKFPWLSFRIVWPAKGGGWSSEALPR